MSAIEDAKKVAVVGSPSTNSDIAVTVLDDATHAPLVGQMMLLAHPITDDGETRIEVGLGVITEVTQNNQFHANVNLQPAIKQHGQLKNLSGDAGDSRTAHLSLQAAYIEDLNNYGYRQSGNGLSTAPPTGSVIRQVTNEVLHELIEATADDLHYLGHLHGTANKQVKVRAPFSMPDFNGSEGAYHSGVFGLTGAGKTILTSYALASQMRHKEMGVLIVDPQGQWSSEEGFVFSVQGFAQELGRPVIVKRISEDLRLSKDAPLFAALLGKTKFMQEIGRMAPENQGYFLDEVVKIVRARDDWDTEDSESLLRHILSTIITENPDAETNRFPYLGRVYSAEDRQARLRDQIQEILSDSARMKEVLRYFFVIHNLFQDVNPAGNKREPLTHVMNLVIKRDMHAAAPLLILDMSTSDATSWLNGALADEEQQEILDSLAILDEDSIKAAILRQVGVALKVSSESAFRAGGALNTLIMLDEAWRYVPPTGPDTEPEIKALSKDFAGYARDWRKFGLGLWFITQSTRSINPDIWDQLLVRFVGYGLAGPDLQKIAEHCESPNDLKLYKRFAPPKSTKPRIYPWLVMGPVSPLSFTKAPIAIAAYTDFDEFRRDNQLWIAERRLEMGQPVIWGVPVKPGNEAMAASLKALSAQAKSNAHASGKTKAVKAQVEQVRANRETGGVDLDTYSLQSTDDSFSSLDNLGLDDEVPPVAGKRGPNGNPIDPDTGEGLPF